MLNCTVWVSLLELFSHQSDGNFLLQKRLMMTFKGRSGKIQTGKSFVLTDSQKMIREIEINPFRFIYLLCLWFHGKTKYLVQFSTFHSWIFRFRPNLSSRMIPHQGCHQRQQQQHWSLLNPHLIPWRVTLLFILVKAPIQVITNLPMLEVVNQALLELVLITEKLNKK